jgi:hypothetical protein
VVPGSPLCVPYFSKGANKPRPLTHSRAGEWLLQALLPGILQGGDRTGAVFVMQGQRDRWEHVHARLPSDRGG